MDPDGPLPAIFRPDADISCEVDAGDFVERKLDALRAHATQITTDGPFFALSNNMGAQAFGREQYRLVKGVAGPTDADSGWETDLFAGVTAE
jgi:N-acetyl-1-D-myo-inositol-2-amino-2-deoxy-alpha-D-glucopyranoside deacetylase